MIRILHENGSEYFETLADAIKFVRLMKLLKFELEYLK